MPARFVVDRGGIVRSSEVDPDYTVRETALKMQQALAAALAASVPSN